MFLLKNVVFHKENSEHEFNLGVKVVVVKSFAVVERFFEKSEVHLRSVVHTFDSHSESVDVLKSDVLGLVLAKVDHDVEEFSEKVFVFLDFLKESGTVFDGELEFSEG